MSVRLILVPYDSGHREWRMGSGPTWLLRHGLASGARALGHEVSAEFVELAEARGTEVGASFALYRDVAVRVRAAREAGALPVVLSGNCGATIGAVAGADGDVGVVWLDAHGDFNTPETSESGFLDGMSLAALTGRCWRPMTAGIRGFRAVPAERVLHVGGRALDPEEETQMRESAMTLLAAGALARGREPERDAALDALASRVRGIHLHLDLDVLDPSVGRANAFAADGGVQVSELAAFVDAVRERVPVVSATFASFDPTCERPQGVFAAAAAVLEALAA